MRTFLINTSPQRVNLSFLDHLTAGLEDQLTVLTADSMEALGTCLHRQVFSPVRLAAGSDNRLKLILFHDFLPGQDVRRDINNLMENVLRQEGQFIQEAVGLLREICGAESVKIDTVTFVFGERCGHGTNRNESRQTLAIIQEQPALDLEVPDLQDPTRMQRLFDVRYAYIDMDTQPHSGEIRNDTFFCFQLMTFACLEAQEVTFPLKGARNTFGLDGEKFETAFELPPFRRDAASEMYSRKISLLEYFAGEIRNGKIVPERRNGQGADGLNAQEEEQRPTEKQEITGGTTANEWNPQAVNAYSAGLFSTWQSNKDKASRALEDMIDSNRKNMEAVMDIFEKLPRGRTGEQAMLRIDRDYRDLASQSESLEQMLLNGKEELEKEEQPVRTPRALLLCLGMPAALYALLTPFGLTPEPAVPGVMGACILAGTCFFTMLWKASLFPWMGKISDSFSRTWNDAAARMKSWKALAETERQPEKNDDAAWLVEWKKKANWHRVEMEDLIHTLRDVIGNLRLEKRELTISDKDKPTLDIALSPRENAAVYGFARGEFEMLYKQGGTEK